MEKQKHSDYNSSSSLYTAPFFFFLSTSPILVKSFSISPMWSIASFLIITCSRTPCFCFLILDFFFVWLQINLLNCTRYRSSKRCRQGKWLSVSNTKPPSKTLAPPASSDWCIRILNLCYIFEKSCFRVEIFMEFRSLSLQTQEKFVFKPNDPTTNNKLDVEFRFIKSISYLLFSYFLSLN